MMPDCSLNKLQKPRFIGIYIFLLCLFIGSFALFHISPTNKVSFSRILSLDALVTIPYLPDAWRESYLSDGSRQILSLKTNIPEAHVDEIGFKGAFLSKSSLAWLNSLTLLIYNLRGNDTKESILQLNTPGVSEILHRIAAKPITKNCNMYNCFNVSYCQNPPALKTGPGNEKSLSHNPTYLTVGLGDKFAKVKLSGKKLTVPPHSQEALEIRDSVKNNYLRFADSTLSCIMIPGLDLLNMNRFNFDELNFITEALYSLPRWQHGNNHLLFSMIPKLNRSDDAVSPLNYEAMARGSIEALKLGKNMIASSYFTTTTYRKGFDISIPFYHPKTLLAKSNNGITPYQHVAYSPERDSHFVVMKGQKILLKKWLIVNTQNFLNADDKNLVSQLAKTSPNDFGNFNERPEGIKYDALFRHKDYSAYDYLNLIQESTFCLILPNGYLTSLDLSEALMSGCIPVILRSSNLLPFFEILDYSKLKFLKLIAQCHYGSYRFAIILYRQEISDDLFGILANADVMEKIDTLRIQGKHVWDHYFSSVDKIVQTTVKIIEQRLFPTSDTHFSEWNVPITESVKLNPILDLARVATNPQITISNLSRGFTAVLLTYDRVDSLKLVLNKLLKVPSLAAIYVIWNNPAIPPPKIQINSSENPKNLDIKVIPTEKNVLGNRFLPSLRGLTYPTECILSIDDDINMVSTDELEFGYQVWLRHPDHLVGYPSRFHHIDNTSGSVIYNSTWATQISMALTGVAFYHKHLHYMYTNQLPKAVRNFVNDNWNCEDIAMNFILAHITGNPALKVSPRQKYECKDCATKSKLSLQIPKHLASRGGCMTEFIKHFNNRVPLKTIEFRVDPLLYKVKRLPPVESEEGNRVLYADMGHL